MELHPNDHVNLGIGMPEGLASVANEERIFKYFTLSAETGVIGGIPAGTSHIDAEIQRRNLKIYVRFKIITPCMALKVGGALEQLQTTWPCWISANSLTFMMAVAFSSPVWALQNVTKRVSDKK